MAFIEQIEKQSLRDVVKNKWLYFVIALFQAPLLFTYTNYDLTLLVMLGFIFAVIFTIDIKEYIIPDTTQVAVFSIANGLIWLAPERGFIESYVGMLFAGGMFYGIYYVFEKFLKKEALGFGDVKLFANVGLLLGFFSFNYFLWILTFTSGTFIILKLLFKKKNKLIPYGPFIVASAWFCLLYKDYLDVMNYKFMQYVFG
tara:strand:+ start:3102 stop:3701 length:600 start_codon:yes stop_codon:yes gene_type:complete